MKQWPSLYTVLEPIATQSIVRSSCGDWAGWCIEVQLSIANAGLTTYVDTPSEPVHPARERDNGSTAYALSS